MPKSAEVNVAGPGAVNVSTPNYYPADIGSEIQRGFAALAAALKPIQDAFIDDLKASARAKLLADAARDLSEFSAEFDQQAPEVVISTAFDAYQERANKWLEGRNAIERSFIADRYPLMVTSAASRSLQNGYQRQEAATKQNLDIQLRSYTAMAPSASDAELDAAFVDLRNAGAIMQRVNPGVDYTTLISRTQALALRGRQQAGLRADLQVAYDDPAALTKLGASTKDFPTFQAAYGDPVRGNFLTEADYAAALSGYRSVLARRQREDAAQARADKVEQRMAVQDLRAHLGVENNQRDYDAQLASAQYVQAYDVVVRTAADISAALEANPLAPISWADINGALDEAQARLDASRKFDTRAVRNISLTPELAAELSALPAGAVPHNVLAALFMAESRGGRVMTGDGGQASGPGHMHPEVAARYGADAAGVQAYLNDLMRVHDGDLKEVLSEYHWGRPNYEAMKSGRGVTLMRGGERVTLTAEDMQRETQSYLGAIIEHVGRDSEIQQQQLTRMRTRLAGMQAAQEWLYANPDPDAMFKHIASGAVPAEQLGAWDRVAGAARAAYNRDPDTFLNNAGLPRRAPIYAPTDAAVASFDHARGWSLPQIKQAIAVVESQETEPGAFAQMMKLPYVTPDTNDGPGADFVAKLMNDPKSLNDPTRAALVGGMMTPGVPTRAALAAENGLKAIAAQPGLNPTEAQWRGLGDEYYDIASIGTAPGVPGARWGHGVAMLIAATAIGNGKLYDKDNHIDADAWAEAREQVFANAKLVRRGDTRFLWPASAPFDYDYMIRQSPGWLESYLNGPVPEGVSLADYTPLQVGPGRFVFYQPRLGTLLEPANARGVHLTLDLNSPGGLPASALGLGSMP